MNFHYCATLLRQYTSYTKLEVKPFFKKSSQPFPSHKARPKPIIGSFAIVKLTKEELVLEKTISFCGLTLLSRPITSVFLSFFSFVVAHR